MADIQNGINNQVGNLNIFTEKVISELQTYIIIAIILLCLFIIINLITCCVVVLNRKSIKKIENRARYV